jgi:hypothetical protein
MEPATSMVNGVVASSTCKRPGLVLGAGGGFAPACVW